MVDGSAFSGAEVFFVDADRPLRFFTLSGVEIDDAVIFDDDSGLREDGPVGSFLPGLSSDADGRSGGGGGGGSIAEIIWSYC